MCHSQPYILDRLVDDFNVILKFHFNTNDPWRIDFLGTNQKSINNNNNTSNNTKLK